MTQYLSPGVYVEEVKSSIQPIAGVGTSTAGFIGAVDDDKRMPAIPGRFVTDENGVQLNAEGEPRAEGEPAVPERYELAPAGEPRLVTSWESFKTQFGDFHDPEAEPAPILEHRILAHAVYGFFNNGGTRCWVTRVAPLPSEPEGPQISVPVTEVPPPPTVPPAPEVLGTTEVTRALEEFEAIDEIAVVAVPGAVSAALQDAIVSHCERMGDRFAVLDGKRSPAALTAAGIKGMQGTSNYAALYFPWISVFDPATKANLLVPPSGHIAGIYARVDSERGVHKAPANERVRGALGLESRLGRADQDGLNPAGINVIRELNGTITVWGARTLGGDLNGEWKYINVRRLFLYLRESIDEGTQWVVFEPNTPALWSKITRNVTAFLTNVWRGGALFGSTPAEAFYVRCDASTNPQEVRDLGQVVTEVGVAVAKPAEFVIFRISQWGGPGAA
jgi:phage tail sheath protein FI